MNGENVVTLTIQRTDDPNTLNVKWNLGVPEGAEPLNEFEIGTAVLVLEHAQSKLIAQRWG